jgi:hypothetical protein
MAASKELRSVCEKVLLGKQKTISCGVYDLRFHCSRVQHNECDRAFFTPNKKSSYKCVVRTTLLIYTRNDETPVKHDRSLSASDAIKNVIPLERQLNLPELTSNESPSVQTETVRLNGQTTINLVEKLLAMTTNLTFEVSQLKSDNAVLKVQISELQDLLSVELCHMEAAAGTMSSQPAVMSYNDGLAISQHQQARNVNTSKILRI